MAMPDARPMAMAMNTPNEVNSLPSMIHFSGNM